LPKQVKIDIAIRIVSEDKSQRIPALGYVVGKAGQTEMTLKAKLWSKSQKAAFPLGSFPSVLLFLSCFSRIGWVTLDRGAMPDNWPFVGAYSNYLKLGLITLTALLGFVGLITQKDKSRSQRILLLVGISITFIFSLAISVSDIRNGQIAARKHDVDLKRILRPISQPKAELEFRLALDSQEDSAYIRQMLNAFRQKVKRNEERESQFGLVAATTTFSIQIGGFGEKTPLHHLLPRARSVPGAFNVTNDLVLYFQHQSEGVSCKTPAEIADKPDLVLISKEESGEPSIDLDPTVSWGYSTSPERESIDLRRTVALQTSSTDGNITSVEDVPGSTLLVGRSWPEAFSLESLHVTLADGVSVFVTNFQSVTLPIGNSALCFTFPTEGALF
jgi:hypothetical protein